MNDTSSISLPVATSTITVDTKPTPTLLSIQDLITSPTKAEHVLDRLTSDQIMMIEKTIDRVKRRRLDKSPGLEHAVPGSDTASFLLPSPSLSPSPLSCSDDSSSALVSIAMMPLCKADPSTAVSDPPLPPKGPFQTEPVAEVRDGVEWLSFTYSHNRVLKRYTIRTDIHNVCLSTLDDKFKTENCVYPRANLSKEAYRGNRWEYETECNVLGWKLAWLNGEITGKRGLIQRAVDSYRNRFPSMRSRRVARQEKLVNGTLRKRRQQQPLQQQQEYAQPDFLMPDAALMDGGNFYASSPCPQSSKTLMIDENDQQRFRIKIQVDNVNINDIPIAFRQQNCVFPRAMTEASHLFVAAENRVRRLEESMCNELGWKLAWINQRVLANKKNRLQRALDVYRAKFMPTLQPRKHSIRLAPLPTMPLTQSALSAQNAQFDTDILLKSPSAVSCATGTTITLDFDDCLSLAQDDHENDTDLLDPLVQQRDDDDTLSLSAMPLMIATTMSHVSSSNTSVACTPSPNAPMLSTLIDIDEALILPPSMSSDCMLFGPSSYPDDDMAKLYNPAPPSTVAEDLADDFMPLTLF